MPMEMENENMAYAAGIGLFIVFPACMGGVLFGVAADAMGTPVAPAVIVGMIGGGGGIGGIWAYVTWDQTVDYLRTIRESFAEIFETTVMEEETTILLSDALPTRQDVHPSPDPHYGSINGDPQGSPYSLFSRAPAILADASDEENRTPPGKRKEDSSDEEDLSPPTQTPKEVT